MNALLARFEASDLSPSIAPLLAAAAAELAALVGVVWRFRSDEPAVASLRMIARAASRRPDARGPDTARLVRRIESGSV